MTFGFGQASERIPKSTEWLQRTPIRKVFCMLGERFAQAEPSVELVSWLVDQLKDPEIMVHWLVLRTT